MAKEIELKLTLSPHHVGSLLQQPVFGLPEMEALGSRTLHNCYYDSPEQVLQQARVALRVRKQDTQFIQTLKSKGTSQAGLSQRNEWEWPLNAEQLDYDLLTQTAWPDLFEQPPTLDQLVPVFNTDFTRQLWMYRSQSSNGEAIEVEVALDSGEVWVDIDGERRSEALNELELELKQGQPSDLFDLAIQLARHIPLQICDISKAERGYRLYVPAQYQIRLQRPQCGDQHTLEQTYSQLLQFELQSWPRHLEAWQFSGEWEHGIQALDALRNIQALRQQFSNMAPISHDDELTLLLEKFTDRLQGLLHWRRCSQLIGPSGANWTRREADYARTRIEVLSQTVEAGLIGLLLGEQLSKQSWRQRWQAEHQALAETLLADI